MEAQTYQYRVDRAIETLNAELPRLFEADISYQIYSNDIDFQDPISTFKNKFNYRIIFWSLRFHGRLFFEELHFNLHDIKPTDRDTIFATWNVEGILRLPWKPKLFFNGNSTYKLNSDGLIYEHIDRWDRQPSEILQQFFVF